MRRLTRGAKSRPLLALAVAGLFWLLVFAAFLRFGEGGLTLFYEIPPEATDYRFTFQPEGIVRVTDSHISADGVELSVHLRGVGRGVTRATLLWDGPMDDALYERELSSTIHALPFGILFDSITWNFSGWEFFTFCLSLFLLTASLIFFLASRNEKKRVYYSYRSTALLGLAIFCLVAGFLRADMLLGFARAENAGTVWSLLVSTIVTAQTFMRSTAFVIAGFALAVAASNLVLMRHEGTRPSNMLGIFVSLVMVGGAAFGIWIRSRVDRAVAFARAQQEKTGRLPVLIPSGGKGEDEPLSEAEAMAAYLRTQGFPEQNILIENQSRTTRENMLFSRKLMDASARAAFSTSSYHVYRAGILAAEENWNLDGMGSRTKWYFWPNAFLREFIGLMAAGWLQQLAAAAVITVVSVVLTELVM